MYMCVRLYVCVYECLSPDSQNKEQLLFRSNNFIFIAVLLKLSLEKFIYKHDYLSKFTFI